MPPIEICFSKNDCQIEANQSADINFFIKKVKDETISIHVRGKKDGGDVTIKRKVNNQIENTNISLKSGQINKQENYHGYPIIIIGHGE